MDLSKSSSIQSADSITGVNQLRGFKISPDQKYLAYCSPEEFRGRIIYVMEKNDEEKLETSHVIALGDGKTIQGFCWSPTSREIAILSKEQADSFPPVLYKVLVYNLETDRLWLVKELRRGITFGFSGEIGLTDHWSAFNSIDWAL